MSLLLENAIGAVDFEEVTLRPVQSIGGAGVLDEPLPLDVVGGYAEHHDVLNADGHGVVLPLHGLDDAELTGEAVRYREHDLRGPMFGGRGADGDVEWVAADGLAASETAARLRFWHPDHVPDQLPSYHVSPVAAVEPARNPLSDTETLVDGLREYVAEERDAAREANRERAEQGPTTQYQRNRSAIPSLDCVAVEDGEHVFRVREAPDIGLHIDDESADRYGFVRDEFDIHEGNEVLINAPEGVSHEEFPVRATVASTRGRDLRLRVAWDAVESRSSVGAILNRPRDGYGLSPLLNPVPFERQTEALDALADTPMAAALAGAEPLTFEDDAKAASEPLDDELNQDQHIAVDHALLADRLFCIHGPPGTGKTRTLVEFVRRSVQAGRDVLVCADSNQAVDNLLVGSSTDDDADEGSLHAYGQHGTDEFTIHRANARRSNNRVVRAHYGDGNSGSADVVATTNSSAGRLAREFDVLVLDEATQATCASACVPLSRAEKVVLAGDHQQLPPYTAAEGPVSSRYGSSLFEHVYADGGVYEGVGVQLRTQYRMHRDVAYLPNRLFYGKSLRNGQAVPELSNHDTIAAHSFGGREERVNHSLRNPTEARFVAILVERLLDDGLDPVQVGVITPYTAQVDLVRDRLADVNDGDGVVVDTIDAFQGSEREAIVISFVRSNEAGDLGFLGRADDGPRRLNVAMTRAKRHCALVGDWNTLRGHRREAPRNDCTDVYQSIYSDLESSGRVTKPDPSLLP
ncbi:AAA domain-containing protein [Halobaculum rubrum]|uniref:AAA domain-containing protein n=1 Tax=Halobaculum rubrum TaxID=2872158 RepID=UPI001CA3AE0A|nr:AAA domain-containing protein [Halobaculum rubrum]QZY01151.1 AAA family ATPase [Halobaculum rubrum]